MNISTNQLQQVAMIDELASIASSLPRRENILAGKLLKWFDFNGELSQSQELKVRKILAEYGDGFSNFWA
jgi:hypothetical protein